MSASLYIVVEGEDPGFDIFVNGQALARHEDAIEALARQIGSRPLLDFFSADADAMAVLEDAVAHEFAPGPLSIVQTGPLMATQWWSAHDGLRAVRPLIRYLDQHPTALGSETLEVQTELEEYERVLEKAGNRELRWHLAVSWR